MHRIIDFSLNNRFLIIVFTLSIPGHSALSDHGCQLDLSNVVHVDGGAVLSSGEDNVS